MDEKSGSIKSGVWLLVFWIICFFFYWKKIFLYDVYNEDVVFCDVGDD